MRTVILDIEVLAAAAASVGIHGKDAVTAHVGMELEPVTVRLIAAILTRLPVTLNEVFRIDADEGCGKIVA